MFHREIRDRVQTLAPFLVFDRDPYIVLVGGTEKDEHFRGTEVALLALVACSARTA
jgi:uncharacterized membrane protein (UPF0182 family)